MTAKIKQPLIGINSETGENVTGKALTAEMLKYAISTAKGSLLMRPDIGSDLYLYRDKNLDTARIFAMFAVIAEAVKILGDRFTLARTELLDLSESGVFFGVHGTDNSYYEVSL